MITLEQVQTDKLALLEEFKKHNIMAGIGFTKNLEGDYVLSILVQDKRENVQVIEDLLSQNYPSIKYTIKYIGKIYAL